MENALHMNLTCLCSSYEQDVSLLTHRTLPVFWEWRREPRSSSLFLISKRTLTLSEWSLCFILPLFHLIVHIVIHWVKPALSLHPHVLTLSVSVPDIEYRRLSGGWSLGPFSRFWPNTRSVWTPQRQLQWSMLSRREEQSRLHTHTHRELQWDRKGFEQYDLSIR